ncbi:MAG: hypothetical protein AB8B53_07040 [Flavobacteriales bacterium]
MNKVWKIILKSTLNLIKVFVVIIAIAFLLECHASLGVFKIVSSLSHADKFYMILIIGYVISFGSVLVQMFKYNRYKNMEYKDFLESTHTITFPDTEIPINVLNRDVESAFADIYLTDDQDAHGYRMYIINFRRTVSHLKVDFLDTSTMCSSKFKDFTRSCYKLWDITALKNQNRDRNEKSSYSMIIS